MPSRNSYQPTQKDKEAREAARKAKRAHYQPEKPCNRGHTGVRYVANGNCKDCLTQLGTQSTRRRRLRERLNRPEKVLWTNARSRASRFGTEFSIEVADIDVPELCPCCDKAFVMGAPTRLPVPQAPSLDRLDSAKGYTVENIVVICLRCNQLKGDGTAEEHRLIADWMERHVARNSPRKIQP